MRHKEKLLELVIEDYKKENNNIRISKKSLTKTIWKIMDVLKPKKVQSNFTLKDIKEVSFNSVQVHLVR